MSHTAWVFYALWTGALLTGAAWIAARAGMALGRSTRWLWLASALLTVALPLAALAFPDTAARPVGTVRQLPGWSPAPLGGSRSAWAISPVIAWGLLSAAALGWVLLCQWRLARLRRGWRSGVLAGHAVQVSRDFGPAVVGIIRPRIVVPEWVSALPPAQLELVLQHESEHLSRHDVRLLALLVGCIVVMPWQLFLWLQLAGLRLALEIDCDRRVLRRSAIREYTELLLSLAGRSTRASSAATWAVPLVALRGRRSQLERRLEVLTRGRLTGLGRAAALAAGLAAIVLVGAACFTPPPVVERAAAQAPQDAGSAIRPDSRQLYWKLSELGSARRGELIPQTGLYFQKTAPDLRWRTEGC